jgi:ribonuclease HIII
MGRELELVQRHKAEEDLAVAAASILARDEFVKRLAGLGKDLGVELPKGAGTNVDAVAKELFASMGRSGWQDCQDALSDGIAGAGLA